MSLIEKFEIRTLVQKGVFSTYSFDLLDVVDENTTLPKVETAMAEIPSIMQTLTDNLPQACDLSEKIITLQKEKKSLEIKSKSFSWSEFIILLGLFLLIAVGVILGTEKTSPIQIIGIIGSIIGLGMLLKSFMSLYKQSQNAARLLPQVKTNIDTLTSQLNKIPLIDILPSAKIVGNNLAALGLFLAKLKIILSDLKNSETERLLAIDHLFANLQKQKNDRLVLAATLKTAAYQQRQAEAAEQQANAMREQAEYARQAMDKQTAALEEINKEQNQQTEIMRKKIILDESRRHDGEPWRF